MTAIRPGTGIGLTEDEVGASPKAPSGRIGLPLRLALVAAETESADLPGRAQPDRPQGSGTSRAMARGAPSRLVELLVTGPPAVAAIEALDQRHLVERLLPEWAAVRNKPQRNPYHRFTVDRHLLEATANAATMAHRVDRVDLLLIGTLLHDIGKGFPGDHTEVGMTVAARIAARMGLPPADVSVIVNLVRLHLLLPDTATRRNLDDPATAAACGRRGR